MDGTRGSDHRREVVAASIAQLRSRLLDLTAKNPLVSFPHGRATGMRTHVRAVDGNVNSLFAHLGEDKPLYLRSLPSPDWESEDEQEPGFRAALEAARLTDKEYLDGVTNLPSDEIGSAKAATIDHKLKNKVRADLGLPPCNSVVPTALASYATRLGIDPYFDLRPSPSTPAEAQKRSVVEFQALVLPDVLERQLAKIRDAARIVAEETGVSTLHLAIGFLEWFESDASDKPLTSPLLLLRVDINREIVRSHYQYAVSAVGDEPEVNLTLSERLSRDFRIKLPLLSDEETPEAYLARVNDEICKGRPRWAVRHFVTLAHFPFARLAMFQDLDEAQWKGDLSSHPVLASLLGGHEAEEAMFSAEHDVDAPAVLAKVPVLVLDADASQHSAIYDVMSGKDLVIEGPPGTGKSQTITNIIAAALSNGKRVLFVADKQAALQVVKDRLDKVGLGDFCLELHSGKARKIDVLTSLEHRLGRQPGSVRPDHLDTKLRELAATRAALTRYVDLLNRRFGALGLTVHDILWADRRRREGEGAESRQLDTMALPNAEILSVTEVDALRAVLDRFERAAAPLLAGFGEVTAHPWWGVTRSTLSSVDIEQAVREMGDAASAMAAVGQNASILHPFGLPPETTLDDLGQPLQAISSLKVEIGIPADWFVAFAAAGARHAASEWLEACRQYKVIIQEQSLLLDLPAGLQPGEEAKRLEAAWSPLADTVPANMSLHELSSFAADMHTRASLLMDLHQIANELAAAVGLTSPENLGEIAVAASALTLAAEFPLAALDLLTPSLMRTENADVVALTSAAISAATAERAKLNLQYIIPSSVEPSLLRQHAATLANAGFFSFMSPTLQAARLCFGSMCRTPSKASKKTMVTALVNVADHIEKAASIEADFTAREAFGPAYRGLATDIDNTLAAVGWAARVRLTLPKTNNATAIVSAVLLSGDPDRLRLLKAFAASREHGALLDQVRKLSPATSSFAEAAAQLVDQAKRVETAAITCQTLRVPINTRTSKLPSIICALQATAKAALDAEVPTMLSAALSGTCPMPLDEHSSFDAALQLASKLSQLPLTQDVRETLSLTAPDVLATIVIPAAATTFATLENASKLWRLLKVRLGLDEVRLLDHSIGAMVPDAISARLLIAADHPNELGSWISYLQEREAVAELGLTGFLTLWDEKVLSYPLAKAFDRVFYHALVRAAFARHPELDRFTGLGQQEARARFSSLDSETAVLKRQRLGDELARLPVPVGIGSGKRGDYTERSLILLETSKQKRHLSIRQLLDRAGAAAQALKPCFMMSPLSVSQYLKPGGLRFDLLVIDEASQMRPEDAVGAVARCNQIVVVGDPKQLPPSTFFARSEADDDDDAKDEEVDAESILDLSQAVFRPMRRLRWHYRSRHGSLIAFSNKEFYDDNLLIFPSPAEADETQGVASVKLDGIYKARSNLVEVVAICAAAIEHMRSHPNRSLGIATMNTIQRDLIVLEMDRLATVHPEVEAYRKHWSETLERFFIKNLENVQGDERDVIFISTVFGPTVQGGKVLQRFGPINGASGHRRLNVLFTRAKYHLRLFTSMSPDDVLAGPESPRGTQVLKAFLAYAQTGRLEAGVESGEEPDSDFEVFVRDRLRKAGYEVVPQVGVAGFRIDLAVRDPRSPATFLLGIECDGASYHSSRSARDRDILRQQILENLGWTIYRIWSTDWFRDPEGQTKKLISFITQTSAKTPVH